MSFSEGSVIIEVRGPGAVSCRSTRTEAVSRALSGQPWESPAPRIIIGSLYALCPQAQLAGYRAALAEAAGAPVPGDILRRVSVETAGEHIRFAAFDAPRAAGLPLDPEIRRIGELRSVIATEMEKDEPDWERLQAATMAAARRFAAGPGELPDVSSLSDFEAWMHRSETAAAGLLAALFDGVPCRPFPAVRFLDAHTDPSDAEGWFAAGISPTEPTAAGEPRLSSALERWLHHPLIREIREQYGCFVRCAFTARLLDLFDCLRRPQRECVRSFSPAAGTGIAVVECARGTLVTRVVVRPSDRTLREVRTVAPTEWNFIDGGPACLMLSGLGEESEESFRRDAAWILAAVDPCVPSVIRFTGEARNA